MSDTKINYVSMLSELMRRDVYAQRVGNEYILKRDKVTKLVIERSLTTGPAIGQYLMTGDKTQVGVFDLDAHDGATSPETMRSTGLSISEEAAKFGLKAHVFRSGGGNGIHLWFFWDKPQNARYVRHVMRNILAAVGMRDGTGGVAKGEVEVFPKQDRVDPGKFGSLIALPGARASVPLDCHTLEPVEWEVLDIPSIFMRRSDPVPEIAPEEQKASAFVALPGDEREVESALKHVPASDYHTWFRVMSALKHTFGDDGLPLFDAWSASCPEKYPGPDEIARRWRGHRPNGQIGVGTIFYLAVQHGWNGPSNPGIREMNARFGILTVGNATLVIVKNGDRRPQDDLVTLSKQTFIDRLAPETFTVRGEDGSHRPMSKAKMWLGHKLASHYYRIDFDPALPPGDNGRTWNLWTGFGAEPQPGDWSLLKTHIFGNICAGNERLYEWLLNWMALGLQDRGEVIGTAPVLIGMPGTGKGVLAHAYGRLWGAHFVTVTHPEHVLGRFSGHLIARRFVFIDEGTFGGNRREAGQLKTRITEPEIVLEKKGVDAIRMRNRMIFMLASNEASVVPADKNDRRWMIFEVGNEHREDRSYFAAIQRQLEDGGYEAMLHELLHRDTSKGPNPRQVIKTAALFDQIIQVQGPEIGYIHMILEHGRLPQNWVDGAAVTTIKALVEELRRSFPSSSGYVTEIGLGKTLKRVLPSIRTQPAGRYFVKMGEFGAVLQRSTRYVFGALASVRREFEQHVGAPIRWNEDIEDWQSDPEPEWHDDSDVI